MIYIKEYLEYLIIKLGGSLDEYAQSYSYDSQKDRHIASLRAILSFGDNQPSSGDFIISVSNDVVFFLNNDTMFYDNFVINLRDENINVVLNGL